MKKSSSSFSLLARFKSFSHAFRGFNSLFREEHNARIHLVAAICAIGVGVWLGISRLEWIAICSVIAFVFFAELINTAIENLADTISLDYHPKIKIAKDVASASVLIMAILSLIVAGIVFLPYL